MKNKNNLKIIIRVEIFLILHCQNFNNNFNQRVKMKRMKYNLLNFLTKILIITKMNLKLNNNFKKLKMKKIKKNNNLLKILVLLEMNLIIIIYKFIKMYNKINKKNLINNQKN